MRKEVSDMAETATMTKTKDSTARGVAGQARRVRTYSPKVDIVERKDDIVIIADMPGVDEKSVDITLESDTLTISGTVDERLGGRLPEGARPGLREYEAGDYRRVFTINEAIDRDRVGATVKHGVLRLVLPKAEEARSRKIAVKGA
jgi:HSP20 family molecular chaperone IbpA